MYKGLAAIVAGSMLTGFVIGQTAPRIIVEVQEDARALRRRREGDEDGCACPCPEPVRGWW